MTKTTTQSPKAFESYISLVESFATGKFATRYDACDAIDRTKGLTILQRQKLGEYVRQIQD